MPEQNLLPLAGRGEMPGRVASFDWSRTPLGSIAVWPSSLRLVVEMALGAVSPMVVLWGREQTQIYNDACISLYGERHPGALGVPARETWPGLREPLGPLVGRVLRTGEPSWKVGLPLFLDRSGDLEEVSFTVSLSPLRDDDGRVAGILANALETTGRDEDGRRLRRFSHELRGPLNTIAVVADLLVRPSLPEERRREQIEKLQRQVRRMSRLLDEGLDARAVENGTRERLPERG